MEFNATFLVSAISFILFTLLMNRVFYAPLGNIISEREKFIDSALKSAKDSQDKTKFLIDERNTKLEESAVKCREIISKQVENANNKAKTDTDNAKSEIAKLIEEGKQEIVQQSNAAENQLKISVKEIADIISEKILG